MEEEEVAAFGVNYGFLTLAAWWRACYYEEREEEGLFVGLSLGLCRNP
jgi:hypothetical protein